MWPHFKKLPIQPKSRTTIEKSKFRFSWNYDFWAKIKVWTWKKWMKVCPPQNCCHLFVRFSLFEGRLLNLLRIALHLSRELERCSVPFPTICTPTTYPPSSATLHQPTYFFMFVGQADYHLVFTTTSTTSSIWIRAISHDFFSQYFEASPRRHVGNLGCPHAGFLFRETRDYI